MKRGIPENEMEIGRKQLKTYDRKLGANEVKVKKLKIQN